MRGGSTVKTSVSVVVSPYLSVASTVNAYSPVGASGVPASNPFRESLIPFGRTPPTSEKLKGA